jgi:nucleotide-binding universal stress UspA family protein
MNMAQILVLHRTRPPIGGGGENLPQMLIVHPTDLLPTSERAFEHALKLGLAERCRLALVHAHAYDVAETPNPNSFPHVRETLTRWGLLPEGAPESAVGDALGLYVSKSEIATIDPEAGLTKLLNDEHAGMIVLGTRALEGLQRLLKGSFSEHLARDAKLPALFIPNGVDGFVDGRDGSARLRNVLIPIAEDPNASGAVAAALRLAELLGQDACFHLLHVGQRGAMPPHNLEGRPGNEIVRQGPVVDTIVEVAGEVGADLIVMATAGHKGFLGALRGSTTEGVLRRARRALLAVPAV